MPRRLAEICEKKKSAPVAKRRQCLEIEQLLARAMARINLLARLHASEEADDSFQRLFKFRRKPPLKRNPT
jgi:hypothetical protein